MRKATRRTLIFASIGLLIAAALIAARLYLPVWVKDYANAQLNALPGYEGSVEDIDIHLYRGAYTIHALTIKKTGSSMPVPFVKIETMDISVHWGALLRGRVVSKIHADRAEVNFAVNRAGTATQAGENVDWGERVKMLVPIDINRVSFTDSTLSYHNFSTHPEVDVFIRNLSGEITNLRNIVDASEPLPSTIFIRGDSIGGGKFQLAGKINILKNIPDMAVAAKLEGVNLTALNSYFRAFAAIDVEKGSFDGYSEITVKNGHVSGYVKPIARNISLIDLGRESNPIKFLWESLASLVIEIFSNQTKDQFATKIPLSGRVDNIETSLWPALAGIVRNAFVEAFEKGFDRKSGE